MTSLTQVTFDAMLKELYPEGVPEHVATRNRPFLRMVNKIDDFEGDNLVVPVQHEFPMGRSANFLNAQANARPSQMVKWQATQKTDFGNVTIDALTIRSSRSNRGAFVEARRNEIDGMLRALGRSASIALYRDGTGNIGTLSVDPGAGTTLTLDNPDDVANFGVGQTIVFSADGSGAPLRAGGSREVIARDEDAGTLEIDAAADASLVGGDFIFTEGDESAKIFGLEAWIPLTSPSATLFLGVDRSVDPTRLAGIRVNTPANSVEENILNTAERVVRNGGEPDMCFINHTNFSNLVKGLGSKVDYNRPGGPNADVGFRGVDVHTSAGTVTVIPDPDCPPDLGYVLQMDTWDLHHLDGFPHLDTIDGNTGLRQSSNDGIEVRARYWAELICTAPGWNGVFSQS